MTTPNSHTADIDWRDGDQPYSSQFDDIYFSKHNGLAESRYVFIEQNQLPMRWHDYARHTFTIAETGFGTGLNFLALWQAWHDWKSRNSDAIVQHIQFISVEKHPLRHSDIVKAAACWPELRGYSEQMLSAYPPQPLTGQFRFDFGPISLTLIFADAAEGISQLAACPPDAILNDTQLGSQAINVDAWMLDGFSPAKNPQMWCPNLFKHIANLSSADTTLATFTAAGEVRRQLISAGFSVEKVKGFGPKRDMLRARVNANSHTPQSNNCTPPPIHPSTRLPKKHPGFWYLRRRSEANPTAAHVAIIGGGIAGCHTAFALAKRNIKVTLFEQADTLASGASGNQQGVVYTRPSPHQNALNRFNIAAQLFADHLYQHANLYPLCGDQCGVIHVPTNMKQAALLKQFAEQFHRDSAHFRWLDPTAASDLSGVELKSSALYMPRAGWLDPRKLCHALSSHPLIEVVTGTTITELHHDQQHWTVNRSNSAVAAHFSAVVVCMANQAVGLAQTQTLPLKPVRGQVTHLPATEQSKALTRAICGSGYIAPHYDGIHCAGATFTLHNHDDALSSQDHQTNITHLATMLPSLTRTNEWQAQNMEGKVGFRCTTPDYLPLAGPVADHDKLIDDFAGYRQSAIAPIMKPGTVHPDLYCNLGLGSRGLAYAPLCAELVASLITGDILPVSRELYLHLHPARFLVRALKRNQI